MITLVQRVSQAAVSVDGKVTGSISGGLVILLGVHQLDTRAESAWLARKCAHLRVFPDDAGNMNRSLLDTHGEALVVSQFTLYGQANRGHRPSFVHAAKPDVAIPLYEHFIAALAGELQKPVAHGVFGAMMQVSLVNDGPVTIWLERPPTAH